jgi:hypothetical protein
MTRRSLLKTPVVPAFAQAVLSNPIVEENQRPGDAAWQLKYYRRDRANGSGLRSPEIEGYASDTSVYPGESIDLMVSADPARKLTIDFYRTGYYGGKGARHMLRVGPLDAVSQEVPLMGMERVRECRWKPTYELPVPNDWRSGVYLAKLWWWGNQPNRTSSS